MGITSISQWQGINRRAREDEGDEKVGERGEGIEGVRGDKLGKNSLPQLADLGNPAISQQPERSRWAMSLHLSSPLSIHLPAFFSPLPYSPHELASIFFSSLPQSFVLSPLTHDLLDCVPSFASTSLHSCLLLPHLSLSHDVWYCLTSVRARL